MLDRAAPEAPASENLTVFPCESDHVLRAGVEEVVQSSLCLKDCLGATPSGSLLTEECHCPLLALSFLAQTECTATQFQTFYKTEQMRKYHFCVGNKG